jgi:hypothetical protein
MNLSLLVHTFNDYQQFWRGSIDSVSEFVPDIPKYYGTDTEGHYETDFKDFKVLYSGIGSWSDRLSRLLHKIPTDYVLYMQEDHWLKQKPPELTELMQIVTENDLFRLQISEINHFYTLKKAENLHFFEPKSKYLVSHQPSIWKKSFLLQQIKFNEDPWINEYEGTKRLNNDPTIHQKIAIYSHSWYNHMCRKGIAIQV